MGYSSSLPTSSRLHMNLCSQSPLNVTLPLVSYSKAAHFRQQLSFFSWKTRKRFEGCEELKYTPGQVRTFYKTDQGAVSLFLGSAIELLVTQCEKSHFPIVLFIPHILGERRIQLRANSPLRLLQFNYDQSILNIGKTSPRLCHSAHSSKRMRGNPFTTKKTGKGALVVLRQLKIQFN